MSKSSDDKQTDEPRKLYRLPEQGVIAGVAAGFADYFRIDVTMMRVLFVVAIFLTNGFAILAYFLAAIIMPVKGRAIEAESVEARVENLTHEFTTSATGNRVRNWIGAGLVLLGVWLLLRIYYPQWLEVEWRIIWPIMLIVIGLMFIARGRK